MAVLGFSEPLAGCERQDEREIVATLVMSSFMRIGLLT